MLGNSSAQAMLQCLDLCTVVGGQLITTMLNRYLKLIYARPLFTTNRALQDLKHGSIIEKSESALVPSIVERLGGKNIFWFARLVTVSFVSSLSRSWLAAIAGLARRPCDKRVPFVYECHSSVFCSAENIFLIKQSRIHLFRNSSVARFFATLKKTFTWKSSIWNSKGLKN